MGSGTRHDGVAQPFLRELLSQIRIKRWEDTWLCESCASCMCWASGDPRMKDWSGLTLEWGRPETLQHRNSSEVLELENSSPSWPSGQLPTLTCGHCQGLTCAGASKNNAALLQLSHQAQPWALALQGARLRLRKACARSVVPARTGSRSSAGGASLQEPVTVVSPSTGSGPKMVVISFVLISANMTD